MRKKESANELNRNSKLIFERLRSWRLEIAKDIALPAYCVFSDKELWSIAEGDIVKKEDLILIKGINKVRYEKYADEIFDIILNCIL